MCSYIRERHIWPRVRRLGAARGALLSAIAAVALPTSLNARQPADKGDAPEIQADAVSTRFLSEYSQNASCLEMPLKNIHCAFTASVYRDAKKKARRGASSGEFFVKGHSREVVRAFDVGDERFAGQRHVFCVTPDMTFELRSPDREATYAVQAFDDTIDIEKREGALSTAEFYVDSILRAALQVRGTPLTVFLDRSTMHACRKIEEDGKVYLEVSFRCDRGKCLYKRCTVLLDPELQYAIREYEYEWWPPEGSESKGVSRIGKGTVRCERTEDGYVIPTYVREEDRVERSGAQGGTSSRWREYHIEVVSVGDVTDSQFTLAAFGLPEVSLRHKRGWYPFDRWYFWSLMVAAVGGWFYLQIKRRSHAT